MSLTLKIIAPTKLIPGQSTEYCFDKLGGSIGRKPNNDFILLDPERYISSKHAIVEYSHDKYYITDTSTNGIYLNNSKVPLGSGNSEEIMNGDKISIGDFQLLASIGETAGNITETSPIEELLNTPPPQAEVKFEPSSIDESFYNTPDTMDENVVDPLAILGGALETDSGNSPLINTDSFTDNLGFNTPPPDNDNFMPSSVDIMADDNFIDSFIGNPHENIPEPSPVNEPFTPPSVIPDDWDIMADPTPAPSSANIQPDATSTFDGDDIFNLLDDNISSPIQNEPSLTPQQTPSDSHQSAHSNTNSNSDSSFVDSFLKGAGIDPQKLSVKDKHAFMQKIGRITRSSTEGLMLALRARATIKSTFRVNKTTISPVENNPLKFLVTADDALITLLSDDKAGYMAADDAFSEGFKDIQTHQMALMAGMQGTIKAITQQFDPVNLERSFDPKTSSGLIPGQKKAKNWECYTEFHAKLSERLQDDFQNVYGEEFANAYEIQINKLL